MTPIFDFHKAIGVLTTITITTLTLMLVKTSLMYTQSILLCVPIYTFNGYVKCTFSILFAVHSSEYERNELIAYLILVWEHITCNKFFTCWQAVL